MRLHALFRLAFASAPCFSHLTSPHRITRRLILQEARRQACSLNIALRLLVSLRFQVLFHSPYRGTFHLSLTVLVLYRSLCVFSLGKWTPQLHTVLACTVLLRYRTRVPRISHTGLSPSLADFPTSFCYSQAFFTFRLALQPQPCSTTAGLGFSHFARHYFGNILFSSGYLDVSVPLVPPCTLFGSCISDRGALCRVSPFGHPWIGARSQLPRAFRSVPRPSSALSAKASSVSS